MDPDGPGEPDGAEAFNMACFRLTRDLEGMTLSVPQAAPLVRRMLRVAGRVVIDTGSEGADPAVWPNTEEMALLWIDEALQELGYQVKPVPEAGRPELPDQTTEW